MVQRMREKGCKRKERRKTKREDRKERKEKWKVGCTRNKAKECKRKGREEGREEEERGGGLFQKSGAYPLHRFLEVKHGAGHDV